MGHESREPLPQVCPVETTEPAGFGHALRVSHMLEARAMSLGGDDLTAAAVDRARLVAWEVHEGERRNRERGIAAAEKLRAMFSPSPSGAF